MTRGERDSGRSDLDSTGPQRSGSDVESWYGYSVPEMRASLWLARKKNFGPVKN